MKLTGRATEGRQKAEKEGLRQRLKKSLRTTRQASSRMSGKAGEVSADMFENGQVFLSLFRVLHIFCVCLYVCMYVCMFVQDGGISTRSDEVDGVQRLNHKKRRAVLLSSF